MKKILLLLVPCIAFEAAHAQTAEEVIQKYTVAMGGLDAYNKIETARITGTLASQGNNFPLTIQIVNGKMMRTDVDVNGQIVTSVYDKGKAWKVNAFENITVPTAVTSRDDIAMLKVQSNLANNLMDYKKREHQVELLEQEEVNGTKAFKIKLTSKDDGKQTTFFISTANYMLLRSDSKQKIQANEFEAQTFYSDLRVISGVTFIMHFVRKIEGTVFQEVTYDKIELNIPITDKVFKMPE